MLGWFAGWLARNVQFFDTSRNKIPTRAIALPQINYDDAAIADPSFLEFPTQI
jgi:hypothetical protein